MHGLPSTRLQKLMVVMPGAKPQVFRINSLNCMIIIIILPNINLWPVPVAARSKAWVCGRCSAGILGSNPTGCMDVCLL